MNKNSGLTTSPERYLVPTAIGIVIGASLCLLGTPLLVVLLLAGMASAYACGWRIVITRSTDRIIDV